MSDFNIGSNPLPPDASAIVESLAQATSPSDGYFRSFLASSINSELGAAWTATKALLKNPTKFGNPVASSQPFDLEPFILKNAVMSFPALGLWRSSSSTTDYSLDQEQRTSTWELIYVVGQCSFEDLTITQGILQGVENVLGFALNRGYLDGYQKLIGEDSLCGFHQVSLMKTETENIPSEIDSAGLVVLPVLKATIQTIELLSLGSSLNPSVPLQGVNVIGDMGDLASDAGILDDIFDVDIDVL